MTDKSLFHRMFSPKTRPAVIQGIAGLLGAVIGGAIVASANIVVNWWIVPVVQREQKHIDRQYESLGEVGKVSSDCIWNLWNGFYSIQGKDPSGNQYRDRVQESKVMGEALRLKFPVLFRDQSISREWSDFLIGIGNISSALGHREISTEEDMRKRLTPVLCLMESVEQKIQLEISSGK